MSQQRGTQKTVFITGGTGIGNALAREFHSRGLRVIATARNSSSISDLDELGIECLSLEVDKPEEVERCMREVEALTGGGLDYLVNNAGRSKYVKAILLFSLLPRPPPIPSPLIGPLPLMREPKLTRDRFLLDYTVPALSATLPEINATFTTNLFAVMHICTTFSPLLIRSRGTIVQIGSLAGIIPYVFGSVYNASKAALHSYSDTLRVELAPFGVNVVTVVTGGVKSNISRTERTLPEGSPYAPLELNYRRRQKHSQEVGMDTKEYAREVVGKILAGDGWIWKRRTIWAGGAAALVNWATTFLGVGSGFWDWIMTRMFGLGLLYKRRDVGKKEL